MELRPGYKKTEIGVIPEEWGIVPLGCAFETQLGKMLDEVKNQGVSRPYLGNRAVQWGKIDVSELSTMRMSSADLIKYRLEKGDLLVCEGGEVGRSAIWSGELAECYFQKALHRLRPKGRIDCQFALAVLQDFATRGIFANFVTQTSIAHLPKEKLVQIPLPEPSPNEQKAIAKALSDVDASIAALSRLIAKKRDLRQGAMQRLLTGQTRLPGFTAPWQEKRLGDHVAFLKNGVQSRAQLTLDDPVRYLHYGDIHVSTDLCLDLSNPDMPRLPSSAAAGLTLLQDGDIVFVDASEDLNGVGKSLEIVGAIGVEAVSGQHTIAARFDKFVLADGFKRYLQFIPAFTTHLRRLAAGTKVYATNRKHIASAELQLPETDEQIAIARVLSDMELEISALEIRLAKTRALKQAMMQALLTGRVRLPVRHDAAPQTKEAAHA
ncbi:restriction endonuclease subunit S [Xanthobacter sp. DSM 14520]|uniref:restriction endonuclease subunit S n=1 Tax=Xanthobacter autotrophicus (strain ATCC BAA-1158 / Py2) TaxID=78245 RepID=UPI00372BB76F